MIFDDFDILYQWFRNCFGVLIWIWAVFLFLIEYYGGIGNDERPPFFRDLMVILIKVMIVSPIGTSATAVTVADGPFVGRHNPPANFQYMVMNPDGQYSFAYSSADSSRQERRNPDGSVTGKYSYTDPNGKVVQVDYTADAINGFNAYGENLPTVPTLSELPVAVQDTVAVKEARQKFLATYAIEYARAQAQIQNQLQEVQSVPKKSVVKYLDKSVVETDPVKDPAAAVAADFSLEDSAGGIITFSEKQQKPDAGQETKVYSVAGGFDGKIIQRDADATRNLNLNLNSASKASEQVIPKLKTQPGPAYFYYVGVGGQPYYVTSQTRSNTNIPVSVRASQLGAIPVDAVHDVQVPNYGTGIQNPHVTHTQPLYVEIGKDYQLPSAQDNQYQQNYQHHPKQNFVLRKTYATQPARQPQSHYGTTTTTVFNLPYFGYPTYIY